MKSKICSEFAMLYSVGHNRVSTRITYTYMYFVLIYLIHLGIFLFLSCLSTHNLTKSLTIPYCR